MIYYACDICGAYHPWEWNGDCREDGMRLYALPYNAEIRTMDERIDADSEDYDSEPLRPRSLEELEARTHELLDE